MNSSQPQIKPLTYLYRYVCDFSIAVDKRCDMYITGGFTVNTNNLTNKASMLNIQILKQKELPDLNQARHGHSSLILNGHLFVMGGFTSAIDCSGSIESLSIYE